MFGPHIATAIWYLSTCAFVSQVVEDKTRIMLNRRYPKQ